jgi:hypothetical protein
MGISNIVPETVALILVFVIDDPPDEPHLII